MKKLIGLLAFAVLAGAQGEGERIQEAHMANIRSMGARGVLVAAGPFDDRPATISGIFVLKMGSKDEALRLMAEDPTVKEHRNGADVVAWRGPKGIGTAYARLHQEKPDLPQDRGVQPFLMLYGAGGGDVGRHEEYVEGLRRAGKVVAAGPVMEGDGLAAIVIFARMPDEEAQRLMREDPAVKSGVLRAEFHRWWCAAHVLTE